LKEIKLELNVQIQTINRNWNHSKSIADRINLIDIYFIEIYDIAEILLKVALKHQKSKIEIYSSYIMLVLLKINVLLRQT